MNPKHYDTIALLLAAEEHPHLREKADAQAAAEALEASASLQADFAEAKAFFDAHPELVGFTQMPLDTRARIQDVLARETGSGPKKELIQLSPWTVRKQFAWAAMLMLLLAGMAIMSSEILQREAERESRWVRESLPPRSAFRAFVADTIRGRLPLQYENDNPVQLVGWLKNQGADGFELPGTFETREGIGCAFLDGPHGKVTMICFGIDGQVVHLFITPARALDYLQAHPPRRYAMYDREVMEWNDTQNAYMLISHRPGTPLPAFPALHPDLKGDSDGVHPPDGETSLL